MRTGFWGSRSRLTRSGKGELGRLREAANAINAIEDDFTVLSDAELRSRTNTYRERLAGQESLDSLLPEAFATVREAASRTLGERHFDTQIMGGVAMHRGAVAEMKTGEGKTLTATLPAYLEALGGMGVHIATSNDYLAKRDAEWMAPVFRFLGMEVGLLLPDNDAAEERRGAYAADVTYGCHEQFGYDYLGDNTARYPDQCVQRGHQFVIVDEADWILIDRARTLLQEVQADHGETHAKWCTAFRSVAVTLKLGADYEVHEGRRSVIVTDRGAERVEDQLGAENIYETSLVDYLTSAIAAKELYQRDLDYIVEEGVIVPLDRRSGRRLAASLPGLLTGAIAAKEDLKIPDNHEPIAQITVRNYFCQYRKLAGMTGTASHEAPEYEKAHALHVSAIPTRFPVTRVDHPDLILPTKASVHDHVARTIVECHMSGQPVLVGSRSVEESIRISELLDTRGVPHKVLNDKSYEDEAEIISEAGRIGAVTVVTGMCGRGTDIKLGGSSRSAGVRPPDDPEEVAGLGGLCVLIVGRPRYLRFEEQLRGRAGRQGDPGESRLFMSWEQVVQMGYKGPTFGLDIESGSAAPQKLEVLVRKPLDRHRKRIAEGEASYREITCGFDEVLNQHMLLLYAKRREIVATANLQAHVRQLIDRVLRRVVMNSGQLLSHRDWIAMRESLEKLYPVTLTYQDLKTEDETILPEKDIIDQVISDAHAAYSRREQTLGTAVTRELERKIILGITDRQWRAHLTEMNALLEHLGTHAIGRGDPLTVYRDEASKLFKEMSDSTEEEIIEYLFNSRVIP